VRISDTRYDYIIGIIHLGGKEEPPKIVFLLLGTIIIPISEKLRFPERLLSTCYYYYPNLDLPGK
jgi:hypothetical protein